MIIEAATWEHNSILVQTDYDLLRENPYSYFAQCKKCTSAYRSVNKNEVVNFIFTHSCPMDHAEPRIPVTYKEGGFNTTTQTVTGAAFIRHTPMTTAELDRLLRRDSHVTDTSLLMSPKGIVKVGGKEMRQSGVSISSKHTDEHLMGDHWYIVRHVAFCHCVSDGTELTFRDSRCIATKEADYLESALDNYQECINCDGFGYIERTGKECECCDGEGEVNLRGIYDYTAPTVIPVVEPVKKPSYDTLYWDYVHAGNEQDAYDRLQRLIGAVNLEMVPAEGSWAHSPDPKAMKQVDTRGREIAKKNEKLNFFDAFAKMQWGGKIFTALLFVETVLFMINVILGHVHG